MDWKRVDLNKEKPQFDGLLNLDTTEGAFVSMTFKCANGLFRIRKNDYTVGIEKLEVPTRHVHIVSGAKEIDGRRVTVKEEFADEHDAKMFKLAMERDDFNVSVSEMEIPLENAEAQQVRLLLG